MAFSFHIFKAFSAFDDCLCFRVSDDRLFLDDPSPTLSVLQFSVGGLPHGDVHRFESTKQRASRHFAPSPHGFLYVNALLKFEMELTTCQ
jgi:hypothetical protein